MRHNVRALCGKHIALRSTPFGRYKYEWPEVGDIDSKSSRDTAAKSRYKLPKHVFSLYKSAESHTKHTHTLPLVAKSLFLIVPLVLYLGYSSYKTISGKFHPQSQSPVSVVPSVSQSGVNVHQAIMSVPVQSVDGLEPFSVREIENHHPFDRLQLSIVGRIHSATKDIYRFSASENGQHAFFTSSDDLKTAGYFVFPLNDCSVKIVYKAVEFFVVCDKSRQSGSVQIQPQAARLEL